MVSALPGRRGPVKDPVEFRRKMTSIRSYFGGNLVRSVQDNLVRSCQKFVSENRLKYGDILLYLIFQDQHSTFLSLTAKQVVYKKWKVREKMSLIRTLKQSLNLTKIQVPGIVNDSLLFVIAENCRLLEDLDVSVRSLISDVEDADFAEVALDLQRSEQTLQLAQATGSRLMQQSLLRFL